MADVERIHRLYAESEPGTLVVTTEKDETRLHRLPLSEEVKAHLYVLPIEVEFLFGGQTAFNKKILDYVGTSSRDSSLSER